MDKVWQAAPAEAKQAYGKACAETAKRCCEEFLTDWAWDPMRVTEGLAEAATRTGGLPRELSIGSDARFGLQPMRHLPAAYYERVIYYWMSWHLVEPVPAADDE